MVSASSPSIEWNPDVSRHINIIRANIRAQLRRVKKLTHDRVPNRKFRKVGFRDLKGLNIFFLSFYYKMKNLIYIL